MKTLIITAFLLISSRSFPSDDLKDHLHILNDPSVLMQNKKSCGSPIKAPTCKELSDSFCTETWKPGNSGNFKTPNGELKYGKSPKSETSLVKIMDLKAFIDSSSKFPDELRQDSNFMALVQKLKTHLENENSSTEWGNELAIINFQISNQQSKIAKESVFKKHPELREKPEKAYSLAEKRLIDQANYDLQAKIIEAKYKDSEKWKKVEKMYLAIKASLIKVIESTSLPKSEQAKMKKKLQSVELSLPYTDPKLLGSDSDCSKDTINAYYNPGYNKFTLCIGEFNADSSGALAFTIGHELAHSIDLPVQASDAFQSSPIVQGLKPLLKQDGQIKDCNNWNKLMAGKTFEMPKISNKQVGSLYHNFKNCLIDKTTLADFNEDNVIPVMEGFARGDLDYFATRGDLALSLTPDATKNSQKVANDYYLNPKNWDELVGKENLYYPPTMSLFQYAMACKPGQSRPIDVSKMPEEEKEKALDDAAAQTILISQAFYRTKLSICGDECIQLAEKNLSKPSGENFADWFGSRATALYMESMPNEKKSSFALEMGAFLCENPEYSYDPVFTSAQKKHSTEVHEDNRIRRSSLFSPEIATQASCELDPATNKGFNLCKL